MTQKTDISCGLTVVPLGND